MTELRYAPVPEMRRIGHIHFVGIGGAGMCGIAEVLLQPGLPRVRFRHGGLARCWSACARWVSRCTSGTGPRTSRGPMSWSPPAR